MNSEVLIPGMKFANKHNLTQKEIEVLIPFFEKTYTTLELSKVLGVHKTTLHHVIQRLKLKHLLILKDKDARGTNLYEFDLSQLEKPKIIKLEENQMAEDEEKKDEPEESSDDSEDSE